MGSEMCIRDRFKIDDKGVIRKTGSSESDRLLVPGNLREEVLALVHANPSSGHQGVQRTKLRVREYFYWWRMGDSVRSYVLTCDTCCRNKRGPLPPVSYTHLTLPTICGV